RATTLAKPVAPTAAAGHEPLRIELAVHHPVGLLNVCALLRFRLLLIKLALGLAQCGAAPFTRAQLLRQLVTARRPVKLILRPVDLRGLLEDLSGDPPIATIRVHRGVRRDLRAV